MSAGRERAAAARAQSRRPAAPPPRNARTPAYQQSAEGQPGYRQSAGRQPAYRQQSGPRPEPARPAAPSAASRPGAQWAPGAPTRQSGIARTGLAAIVFVFVVTLAVATLESLIGVGLRTFTLIALAGSTLIAGLWVRRSDLASVVVAPPLVFTAVAALETALAPTLDLSLPVMATLLVRGFPTMAIATVIALAVCGYRLSRRR